MVVVVVVVVWWWWCVRVRVCGRSGHLLFVDDTQARGQGPGVVQNMLQRFYAGTSMRIHACAYMCVQDVLQRFYAALRRGYQYMRTCTCVRVRAYMYVRTGITYMCVRGRVTT
jgi:hypothetical protein